MIQQRRELNIIEAMPFLLPLWTFSLMLAFVGALAKTGVKLHSVGIWILGLGLSLLTALLIVAVVLMVRRPARWGWPGRGALLLFTPNALLLISLLISGLLYKIDKFAGLAVPISIGLVLTMLWAIPCCMMPSTKSSHDGAH